MACRGVGSTRCFRLVSAAPEAMSEALLVGAVDDSCSIIFAAIDNGVGPFNPELEAGGVLIVCRERRGEDVAIRS